MTQDEPRDVPQDTDQSRQHGTVSALQLPEIASTDPGTTRISESERQRTDTLQLWWALHFVNSNSALLKEEHIGEAAVKPWSTDPRVSSSCSSPMKGAIPLPPAT